MKQKKFEEVEEAEEERKREERNREKTVMLMEDVERKLKKVEGLRKEGEAEEMEEMRKELFWTQNIQMSALEGSLMAKQTELELMKQVLQGVFFKC